MNYELILPFLTLQHCCYYSRRAWNEQEDEAIRQMVAKHGTKSWALIAENLAKEGMPGRSGKQCRERWHNHLGMNTLLYFFPLEEYVNQFYDIF